MAEKNLIKVYVNASSSKRVNLIIKNYNDFMGIVEGYTAVTDMISESLESVCREAASRVIRQRIKRLQRS